MRNWLQPLVWQSKHEAGSRRHVLSSDGSFKTTACLCQLRGRCQSHQSCCWCPLNHTCRWWQHPARLPTAGSRPRQMPPACRCWCCKQVVRTRLENPHAGSWNVPQLPQLLVTRGVHYAYAAAARHPPDPATFMLPSNICGSAASSTSSCIAHQRASSPLLSELPPSFALLARLPLLLACCPSCSSATDLDIWEEGRDGRKCGVRVAACVSHSSAIRQQQGAAH